jgi:hypothetical protein
VSQKYRHHGYKDSDWEERGPRKPAPSPSLSPEERAQKRALRHALDREANEVVRCPDCGRNIQAIGPITVESSCPHCNAALHCCRACRHFDSGARWACRVTIPERVSDKGKRNACALYEARLVLDATGRRTGSTAVSGDPKSVFENLFKK